MKVHQLALWASIVWMILTGLLHSLSFLSDPEGSNELEKHMMDLMIHYKMDMGAGIHRSFFQIHNALSACFTILCLFGAALLWYLIRKGFPGGIRNDILLIYLSAFGLLLLIMALWTFLPPILCSALIFLSLILARWTSPKEA